MLSTGIERDPSATPEPSKDSGVSFVLPQGHYRLTQVLLQDGSDLANTYVQEKHWLLHTNEALRLQGNLFIFEQPLSGEGLILLLPEPLPHARPRKSEWDVYVKPSRGQGIAVSLAHSPDAADWVRLDYSGGRLGMTRALQHWQRAQRPATPGHQQALFLSNTWGDRSRDARMNETFMLREIDAAVELGVDVVQLDDGWERGMTVNSSKALQGGGVWEGFWNADPHFWEPHPERFPNGLQPLVERARQRGVQLGLWFGPDSWNDFANWRRDADCILALHRTHGVCHFKLDGIKSHSQTGLDNLRAFIDAVLTESRGQVVFDLDITAETRPGHFGMANCGVLFIENRYTDWYGYWPHHTLRNLWQLARYVDPLRLRFEFLNPTRNPEHYIDDPLAPRHYSPATLFATVMACNPLGWFEISNLPPAFRAEAGALVRIWKEQRDAFFSGTILPIGDCPEGWGCSGFVSLSEDGNSCHVLIFRGLCPDSDYRIELPFHLPALPWTRLSGDGHLSVQSNALEAHLPTPLGFLFGILCL